MSDVAELIESLDLDAALTRTHERHAELRAAAARRRRLAVAGCLVAAAAAIAIVLPLTLGGGGSSPKVGSTFAGQPTTTTLDPNGTLPTPPGYTVSTNGDVWSMTSTVQPPHDASSGSSVGASSTTGERAQVVSSDPGPVLRSVVVHFSCAYLPEQIGKVSYELTGGSLVVQALESYQPDAVACGPTDAGPVLTLPLPAPLPSGTPVVAGSVPSH